jgi:uncharacterized membrane protein YeaQ/YmgE (transglycosylase-associated protein family)
MAENDKGAGLRPMHFLTLVVVGVLGVLVGFWVLSALAGFIWGLIKLVVIVAVIGVVLYLLLGRSRSKA